MFEFISSIVGGAFNLVGSIVNANTQQSIAQSELKQKEIDLDIAKVQGETAENLSLLESDRVELVEKVKKEIAANKSKNTFYGMILMFLGLIIFVIYRISNKQLDIQKLEIVNNSERKIV